MSVRSAWVIGSRGQDGRLLTEQLREAGVQVIGVDRTGVDVWEAGAQLQFTPGAVDICSQHAVRKLLEAYPGPDDLYYLAAIHTGAESSDVDDFSELFGVNQIGLFVFVQALREHNPACKLFYASSSHVFAGNPSGAPQTEETPLRPTNAYGISKVAGMEIVRWARDHIGMHASSGILYHHDSEYRQSGFVCTRIVDGALAIVRGEAEQLFLGDLNAEVDWGYAGDVVRAMRLILQLPAGDDFVVATGEATAIRDFVREVGLQTRLPLLDLVVEKKDLIQRRGMAKLVGDSTKLRKATGWKPEVSMAEMIGRVIRARREVEVGPRK